MTQAVEPQKVFTLPTDRSFKRVEAGRYVNVEDPRYVLVSHEARSYRRTERYWILADTMTPGLEPQVQRYGAHELQRNHLSAQFDTMKKATDWFAGLTPKCPHGVHPFLQGACQTCREIRNAKSAQDSAALLERLEAPIRGALLYLEAEAVKEADGIEAAVQKLRSGLDRFLSKMEEMRADGAPPYRMAIAETLLDYELSRAADIAEAVEKIKRLRQLRESLPFEHSYRTKEGGSNDK